MSSLALHLPFFYAQHDHSSSSFMHSMALHLFLLCPCSMALHPNGVLVASGQRASQGHRLTANVQVWDSRTLRTIHVLGEGELGIGILALDFSTRVYEYKKRILGNFMITASKSAFLLSSNQTVM